MLKASSNAPPSHQVGIQQTLLLSVSRIQTNDKSTQSSDVWLVEVMKWHPNTSLTCNNSRKICISLLVMRLCSTGDFYSFDMLHLRSVREQEPLYRYAVWHNNNRELSTIGFTIEYNIIDRALRCMPQVPLILGELGMEFLDLQDPRFSFADTCQAKQTEGSGFLQPQDNSFQGVPLLVCVGHFAMLCRLRTL